MSLFRSVMKDKKGGDYNDSELFRRFIKQLAPFKKSLIFITLYIIIQTICDLIIPLLVRFVADEFLIENPRLFRIYIAAFTYLMLHILNWIGFSGQRKQFGKLVPFFLENLRIDLFSKIQQKDMSFFDKNMSGKLNSIIVNDTLDFTNTVVLISNALGDFAISILTFIILLQFSLILSLLILIGIPFLFLLMFLLRRFSKLVSKKYRVSIGNVTSAMVEAIEGIQISKSFGQESNISDQFEVINKNYLNSWMQLTAVTHFWRPLLNTLSSIILSIILYYGLGMILQDLISPGTMVMFVLYLQTFFRPVMQLARFFPELSAGMASYERILGIIDSKPTVIQNQNAHSIGSLEGKIVFDNVTFHYEKENIIFDSLNLEIKKGEKLAIVGHTGSGKTSLVALLGRYYEFQGGSITIDGIDIRDITLESFRKQIGKVEQEIFLFSGTLLENIRYGREDASDEDIRRVIKLVQAEEFIDALPNGIHTIIGERGKDLSAGQRQLISFARAILLNPGILILDEATSSVDAYTEAMIQEALEVVLKNRTSIIIAHRLSTIINADRIIVMDNGKIVEEGTHQQLLDKKGKYSSLYLQYFAHQNFNL